VQSIRNKSHKSHNIKINNYNKLHEIEFFWES